LLTAFEDPLSYDDGNQFPEWDIDESHDEAVLAEGAAPPKPYTRISDTQYWYMLGDKINGIDTTSLRDEYESKGNKKARFKEKDFGALRELLSSLKGWIKLNSDTEAGKAITSTLKGWRSNDPIADNLGSLLQSLESLPRSAFNFELYDPPAYPSGARKFVEGMQPPPWEDQLIRIMRAMRFPKIKAKIDAIMSDFDPNMTTIAARRQRLN
jgi:hypothetical protein